MKDEPRKPEVGQTVTICRANLGGDEGPIDPPMVLSVVGPCEHKTAGCWVCATHGIRFGNQFNKDTHIHARPAAHTLAWFCFTCGTLQVP